MESLKESNLGHEKAEDHKAQADFVEKKQPT